MAGGGAGKLTSHEASLLNLEINKAHHQLGWAPRWDFATTLERTVGW
jgi:CDP-glucose 4,6-dehydratase